MPEIVIRVAIVLSFLCPLVSGQVPNLPKAPTREAAEQPTAAQIAGGVHDLTAQDLEAFLDGIMPLQLATHDIAGATIAVVKNGQVLLAKGYGYADVEKKTPVSAEETLFRVGSVSKLFTWTAVMQLVEEDKLNLDSDVNSYLDFKIPDAFGQPITLKNLLTHTPGFEEQVKDLFTVGSESPNLEAYIETHIPTRIYPPGKVPAYSNYGASLAGYIVERVSGRPFNEYIEEKIFKPLGMNHSTFRQPLASTVLAGMSKGYVLASAGPKPFEMVVPFPAGSLSSTAADMARFMIAHLQDGRSGDASILRPETARLMHSRLFDLDQGANAMAHGFYEESRNGHRIIGHAGDTVYFHTDLHLIPDAGVGLFVSHNSAGRSQPLPRTALWEMFLDRYFPPTSSPGPVLGSAKEDAKTVSGTYILSRRSETSFLKTAALIGEFSVSPLPDGMIEVAQLTGPNGKPKRWREVARMTFLEENGHDRLIFKPDSNGRMQLILPYPFFVGQRVGFFENNKVLLTVIGVSLAIMLLTLLLWPIGWLVRRHYGGRLNLTPLARLLRVGVRLVFGLDVLFLAAMTGLVVYSLSHLELLSDRGNTWFHLVQVVGLLGAIGTLVVIYDAIRSWRRRETTIWGKLRAALFVVACLGFLLFAFAGNLLHFSSSY
jgi:CubicO group peptidase (beta-lactamase class C family)